jgi:drug/metabolite transporter (DMT)-like permease
MNWFFVALGCAFLTACSDAISKRIMWENDEWTTGAVTLGISAIILAPLLLFQDLKPISLELILLIFISLPVEISGYYLFLSAIKMADLSLTLPLLAFTPVLTILTAALLLGESVSWMGAIGIALVTAGAYLLNGDLVNRGLLAPIAAIFSTSGCRRMLLVAFLWAFTSTLGKKGILLYGAIPYGTVLVICIAVTLIWIAFLRSGQGIGTRNFSKRNMMVFIIGGLLMAGAQITHFISLNLAPVAYMISVKRLSLVFGVILGRVFFREENTRYRLIGAVIMVLGIFFIYD